MLNSAHKGYEYQDLLSAYFVASYIAQNKLDVEFLIDSKQIDGDKFDDLKIFDGEKVLYRQIKFSEKHCLEKKDFLKRGYPYLYLKDLFDVWKKTSKENTEFRLCLAWGNPKNTDKINEVLKPLDLCTKFFPETSCYKIDCDSLWPPDDEIIDGWERLKEDSKDIKRAEFKQFLESLIIETNYPSTGKLESLLTKKVQEIGVGTYPNDHLQIKSVCDQLRLIVQNLRADESKRHVSALEIAKNCRINLNCGGIDEIFPIDNDLFVDVSDRLQPIRDALDHSNKVIATAAPGAGKSWLISSLERELKEKDIKIFKHYCYIDLNDSLSKERIKNDTFYGCLKEQIKKDFPELRYLKTFAADVDEVVFLLNQIPSNVLLIIDGVDHIKRIYSKNTVRQNVEIITAIQQLNFNNPNVRLLVISQPLEEFQSLNDFCKIDIPPISKNFVEKYLPKVGVENKECQGLILSDLIYEKSQGNALYCKYIVESAKRNVIARDFSWLEALPAYDNNLQLYYEYILKKLDGKIDVPAALCGVDFSLNKEDLIEITGIGDCVDVQLETLIPILKFKPIYGYSIYHESFKRYLYELFEANRIDIKRKIYSPLINWLENEDFFKNQKAYACLLKLYYENGNYDKILKTVSVSFLEDSMLNACPFLDLKRNHSFQKKALAHSEFVKDFKLHIILAEQSKMLLQIDYMEATDLENYLEAVKYNIDNERAYDFIQREGSSRFDFDSLSRYLTKLSFKPNERVHWELCDFGDSFDLKYIGNYTVMLLKTKSYQKLDDFVLETYEKYSDYFETVLIHLEKWMVAYGTEWLNETPKIKQLLEKIRPKNLLLNETVDCLIEGCKSYKEKELYHLVKNVEFAAQDASEDAVCLEVARLKNNCWFYNWIIFDILTSRLEKDFFDRDALKEAFSYLVKDLDPFKGSPKACDLHYLYPYFNFSFRRALSLSKDNCENFFEFLSILEKVCELETSFRNSVNGPLTRELYLEILLDYAPKQYPIYELERIINDSKGSGYYQDLANLHFKYSVLLTKKGENEESQKYYRKGVKLFWGYEFRKDASIYEILGCLTPYSNFTGKIDRKILLDLFEMSWTIVNHTDGSGTKQFPIDVFENILDVNPKLAINLLIQMGLSEIRPWGYLEEMTSVFLRKHIEELSLEEWFLICQTQPLLNSDSVLLYGLKNIKNISESLKSSFCNWVKRIPFVSSKIDGESYEHYSQETCLLYENIFGEDISKKEREKRFNHTEKQPIFNVKNIEDAKKFFDRHSLSINDIEQYIGLLNNLDIGNKKKLILLYVKSDETYYHPVIDDVIARIDDDEVMIFLCIGYLVYSTNYRSQFENNLKYLKKAISLNSSKTLIVLKYFLGMYLEEKDSPWWVSRNIIRILIEIEADEKIVQEHFNLLYEITANKLPADTRTNQVSKLMQKEKLDDFSLQTSLILLLISRLNRLCIEKSQHIIYALVYFAKAKPKDYIKALTYVYSKRSDLLPICRAALLQIVFDFIPKENVPEKFKLVVKKNYSTGYYYEDYLISRWIGIDLVLIRQNKSIDYPHNSNDYSFIPNYNSKYEKLWGSGFSLEGSYYAFMQRKEVLNKKYGEVFTLYADEIAANHTGLSNAIYEIINEDHYHDFVAYRDFKGKEIVSPFLLENLVRYVGSKERMPSFAPANDVYRITAENFRYGRGDETWTTLVYNEEKCLSVGMGLMTTPSFDEKFAILGEKCSERIFRLEQYFDNKDYRNDDSIIAKLSIRDPFEKHVIWFLSPAAMQKMNLHINSNMFDGLQALDENGNIVAKMIVWDADIRGSIWQGVEIPCQKATALLFRKDRLKLLEPLIS